jgi:hypothetical protein
MFHCHIIIVFCLVGLFVRRIVFFARPQPGGVDTISPILGIAQALMSVLGACRALRSFAGASCFTPSAGQAPVSQEIRAAVSMMLFLFVCCVVAGRGESEDAAYSPPLLEPVEGQNRQETDDI